MIEALPSELEVPPIFTKIDTPESAKRLKRGERVMLMKGHVEAMVLDSNKDKLTFLSRTNYGAIMKINVVIDSKRGSLTDIGNEIYSKFDPRYWYNNFQMRRFKQ